MIRWSIDAKPGGRCDLTLQDGETGAGFLVVFNSPRQLVETLAMITEQAKDIEPLPAAFVKAFPELF